MTIAELKEFAETNHYSVTATKKADIISELLRQM